jgi:hypothetical protein
MRARKRSASPAESVGRVELGWGLLAGALLLVGALLVLGCEGGRDPLADDGPAAAGLAGGGTQCSTDTISQLICELSPNGGTERSNLARYDNIRKSKTRNRGNALEAQTGALIESLFEQYPILLDPPGAKTKPEGFAELIEALGGFGGVPAEAHVVDGEQGGIFLRSDGRAGVDFPPGSFEGIGVLVITKLPDTADPLNTTLPQYPDFHDYVLLVDESSSSNGITTAADSPEFSEPVTVAQCFVSDEIPEEDQDEVEARAKLAHNVGEGIEILEPVETAITLVCDEPEDDIELTGGPTLAGAGKPGSGLALAGETKRSGQVSSFSPFGTVDPGEGDGGGDGPTIEGTVFQRTCTKGCFDFPVGGAHVYLSCNDGNGGAAADTTLSVSDDASEDFGGYFFDASSGFAAGWECTVDATSGSASGSTGPFTVEPGTNVQDVVMTQAAVE